MMKRLAPSRTAAVPRDAARSGDSPVPPDAPQQCARRLMGSMQLVMEAVRRRVRHGPQRRFTPAQFHLLVHLANHEGCSLSDAARLVGLRRPTMTRAIDILERDGWVQRRADPRDRRRRRLVLTPKGRARFAAKRRQVAAVLAERLARLTAEQRRTLMEALHWIEQAFGDDGRRCDDGRRPDRARTGASPA